MTEFDILRGQLTEGEKREGVPNTLIVLRPTDLWNLAADRLAVAKLAVGLANNLVDSQVVGGLHLVSNVSVCVGGDMARINFGRYDVIVYVDLQLLDIDRMDVHIPDLPRSDRQLVADRVGLRIETPRWLGVIPGRWELDKPPDVPSLSSRRVVKGSNCKRDTRGPTLPLLQQWQQVRKPCLHVPGGSRGDYEMSMPYSDGYGGDLPFPLEFGSTIVPDGDMVGLRTVRLQIVDVARKDEIDPVAYCNTLERMTAWLNMLLVPIIGAVNEGVPVQEFKYVTFSWVVETFKRAFEGVGRPGSQPGHNLVYPGHFLDLDHSAPYAYPLWYPVCGRTGEDEKWRWQETVNKTLLAKLPPDVAALCPGEVVTVGYDNQRWFISDRKAYCYTVDGRGELYRLTPINPKEGAADIFGDTFNPRGRQVFLWKSGILMAKYSLTCFEAYKLLFDEYKKQRRQPP